jgi:hypothetical protein
MYIYIYDLYIYVTECDIGLYPQMIVQLKELVKKAGREAT